MNRSTRVYLAEVLCVTALGCTGNLGSAGSGTPSASSGGAATTGTGNAGGATVGPNGTGGNTTTGTGGGAGGSSITPGGVTVTPMPFEAVTALTSTRKVKSLLTGLAPTSEDVATVAASGAAGLQTLINTWLTDATFQDKIRDKMLFLFRNLFQQTGFTATEDFKPQLLQNGGFDFGPFGTRAVGDDAFFRLVQNLQDSFALTAWQLVLEGRPFSDVLTTQRFMLTTGLKSLYIQVEMPNDQPFAFNTGTATKLAWKVDMSGTAIPLADSLNAAGPNYMTFDDQAPVNAVAGFGGAGFTTCQGTAGMVNAFTGYSLLFQRLIGFTPRFPFSATPQCFEHASRPIFTAADLSDWQMVSVRPLKSGETYIKPYDLPTLRAATEIGVKLPRIGYYTTPAYLALWNTNDSNQHRVTANQTLLVALGQSFTSADAIIPLSTAGLDAAHAVAGSECYGCHKSLDTMRQFWATQYDYNDRNDFPARASFMGAAANPRPATTGGTFAFANVNASGASILDFGNLLLQVADAADPQHPINRFALAVTQKLCFFANSAPCVESDPEYRRVAKAFEDSNFNFPSLIKELFSSPLVTGASPTATFDSNGMLVSIARRDQLCASLSNRTGKADLCALAIPLPSTTQAGTFRIAGSVPADGFSRGSEIPVTPSDPTLFFRAASEMLCENVANQVVDAASGSVYSSTDVAGSIASMVQNIMGYPASDTTHYAAAVAILNAHFTEVQAVNRNTATTALRSTFALACESPTSLSFGL